MPHTSSVQSVLILDYGSQYTQLIARRIREERVYCEILPYNTPIEKIKARTPHGIILSGGPGSVNNDESFKVHEEVFALDVPVLGICYGMQAAVALFGGSVISSSVREYGLAKVKPLTRGDGSLSPLLKGVNFSKEAEVWMSHGDTVSSLPSGFTTILESETCAQAGVESERHRFYGLQFHPEVTHSQAGQKIIKNFLFEICAVLPNWTMSSVIIDTVASIKKQVGGAKVISAISGGVDSTVASYLTSKAIGNQLHCIFIDNGLLRKDEGVKVHEMLTKRLGLNVHMVDASELFLSRLAGVNDPEKKRKIIGETFIDVFTEEAQKLGDVPYLVQGTLYPDVIESVSVNGPSAVIKSHHNVGGLPEKMQFSLIEPLRELFKDEVRTLGTELGIPAEFIQRQPFPGPGLAIRIIGEITKEKLSTLREADAILLEEIKAAGFYTNVWQTFAVLLPIKSVGVMGDARTYEEACVIRAVESKDGMTANVCEFPFKLLTKISSRIINEVQGINRVAYDISSKPPATIEWE